MRAIHGIPQLTKPYYLIRPESEEQFRIMLLSHLSVYVYVLHRLYPRQWSLWKLAYAVHCVCLQWIITCARSWSDPVFKARRVLRAVVESIRHFCSCELLVIQRRYTVPRRRPTSHRFVRGSVEILQQRQRHVEDHWPLKQEHH